MVSGTIQWESEKQPLYSTPSGLTGTLVTSTNYSIQARVKLTNLSTGSAYYSSTLPGIITSSEVSVASVDELIGYMNEKNFYTIARISAFRDYNFGLNNVPSGLYLLNRAGLWADNGGYYWLDPTNPTTTNWITSVVLELKGMGFDEVMLDNFRFPSSDKYIFNGDKPAALASAAQTLMSTCGANDFVLSFCVEDPMFSLPEGRSRMYLSGVGAGNIAQNAALTMFEEKETRLVFLSETADTRYDQYSVLRNLYVAEETEARKAG